MAKDQGRLSAGLECKREIREQARLQDFIEARDCRSGLGREFSRAQDLTPNSRASSLLQDLIEASGCRNGFGCDL
jgi:hypothetical protein